MRILIVTQYFWPENFRINDLTSELVGRGHEVTVLTGFPNYPEGEFYSDFVNDPKRFSNFAGARIIRIPLLPRKKGSTRLILNYLSFVLSSLTIGTWKLRGLPFDAIFVFQTSPITVAIPAIWFRRTKQAPVLMWVLDLWPESVSAVGAVKSPQVMKWIGYVTSFIYRRCDQILVQSKAFIPNILKYSGTIEQIRYFPNWSEPIFQSPLEDAVTAEELEPYSNTFNILFAGNIGDAQDFPTILDAAEKLKEQSNIRWLIVGDGRAANWVRAEIVRRDLARSIILLGRHPLERMPSFFRGAQALLVTLKKDPIFAMTVPGKIQSYLAVGLPIIALLEGEGARVLRESQAALVAESGDADALAKNIQTLVSMRSDERERLGKNGLAYCYREFNRKTLFNTLDNWIKDSANTSSLQKTSR